MGDFENVKKDNVKIALKAMRLLITNPIRSKTKNLIGAIQFSKQKDIFFATFPKSLILLAHLLCNLQDLTRILKMVAASKNINTLKV